MLFGVVFTEILSAVFMIWDDFFVSIYTTSSAVAAFAISRMQHVCSLEGLTATYEVESAALRGMGKSLACHLHRARHGRFPTHLDGNDFPSRAHVRDADGRLRCLVGVHRRSAADRLSAAYAKGFARITSENTKTEVHAPGFHAFASQIILFHARCRAAASASQKRTLLTD